MMIVFPLVTGLVIYYIFFNENSISRTGSILSKESPEELLKRRFATGEIDEKTYIQMKETLKG